MAKQTNSKKPEPMATGAYDDIDTSPPHSPTVEQAILGAIIVKPEVFFEHASELTVEDFFDVRHRNTFRVIAALAAEGKNSFDYLQIMEALNQDMTSVGGVTYLCSLSESAPANSDWAGRVNTLKKLKLRRKLIQESRLALAKAMDPACNISSVIPEVSNRILAVATDAGMNRAKHISEVVPRFKEFLGQMSRLDQGRSSVGLSTTLKRIDKLTTGLRMKEISYLVGAMKDGKTALAVQIMIQNANEGVLYFSHEMDDIAVMSRGIAQVSRISHMSLRDPRGMQMFEWGEIDEALKKLSATNFWIEDAASMHIDDIVLKTRLHVRRDKIKLVVVDYIQKVNAPGEGLYDRVTHVSSTLAALAKQESCHVMVLSQVSNPDKKIKKRPTAWDLKGSGDMAADAHLILGTYRPTDNDGRYTKKDEIGILAQRSGEAGVWIPATLDTQSLMWNEAPESEHRDDN